MKSRICLCLLAALVPNLRAFDAARSWPSGSVTFALALDGLPGSKPKPSGGIADGSASWNAVAQAAIDTWKPHLKRIQISTTAETSAPSQGNGRNEVAFSDNAFGQPFGERVLAITYSSSSGDASQVRIAEADILVNNAISWDSYRGNLRSGGQDLKRVLVHEVGHALGLDHPDDAHPAQDVDAIMNSVISNRDSLATDDIDGVAALYGTTLTRPTIASGPTSQVVSESASAMIGVMLQGGTPASSPTLKYNWYFTPPGGSEEWLFGQPEASIPLGTAQTYDAGRYRVVIETPDDMVRSSTATLNVTPAASSSNTHLYNLSTRGFAGTGDDSLIAGFVVESASTRKVLVRAVGPGLAQFGVKGYAADPIIELRKSGSDALLGSNDDWGKSDRATLTAAFANAGAFSLDGSSRDAAIIVDLPAGNYTAVVQPKSGSQAGIVIVELYDISTSSGPHDRLYNLSTRGPAKLDGEILIGGLVVRGDGPSTYLIRAAGDTLSSLGVGSTLDDPTLRLFDASGNLMRYVDDWDSPAFFKDTLSATFSQAGAFPFTDRQESALRVKLKPGNYTVHVQGFNGGTGTTLLEIYELD